MLFEITKYVKAEFAIQNQGIQFFPPKSHLKELTIRFFNIIILLACYFEILPQPGGLINSKRQIIHLRITVLF